MSTIIDIHAREILDSRGNPTVEVDVTLEDGTMGRAAVPSGASTGVHEAVEKRDGDKSRYMGKGVLEAVAAVNGEIWPKASSAPTRPSRRPSTPRCARSTAPRTRAGSAPTRSSASPRRGQGRRRLHRPAALPLRRRHRGAVLPVPMMNIVNGGEHADNPIDIQEFMIMPVGADSIARGGAHGLRGLPHAEEGAVGGGLATGIGDEGGFAPEPRRPATRSISS
jgi:enolase